uniref:Formylglycine-generating enzyme, required for sulfatase activity, contains SUMF1/FGE domain n=1 Tax=Candidatus Kentrum sp. LFY TaxID=2126342 RepID=A0A450U7D8_9GAMM|nr:MAG: Formylglycine-generating enzyme, required for sulfatase activity, contains SUMF1/FGE domain [Candidatus Kentron sp. LFY]
MGDSIKGGLCFANPPYRVFLGVILACVSLSISAQDESVSLPSLSFPTQPCRSRPGEAPEMAIIASGRFLMGSPEGEKGRSSAEGLRHGVSVVKPFAIGRCEVTVGEFRTFIEDTGYRTDAERGKGCTVFKENGSDIEVRKDRGWKNPGFPQTEHHPVVCVSWNDARAYAYWLTLRTGYRYRLPSEAEWEYAARGVRVTGVPGPLSRRYWGDDPEDKRMCEFANGADPTLKEEVPKWGFDINENCRDGFAFTAPAASFRPNAFGLFDMVGNAWEWTADCWHENYQGAPVDGSTWGEENGGDCSGRVVRGGSWSSIPRSVRSAFRYRLTTLGASHNLGFRLARDL